MAKKIMICAGEASGDQRAAEVVLALKSKNKDFEFLGIGGDEMRAAGVNTLIDIHELAVMGFVEVIKHLPHLYRVMKRAKMILEQERPDVLVLVDYPGFNLRLAKAAKILGIKVLFYVSPQVWAWRQGRVKKIVKVVDHMAVIFPFEKKFYESYKMPVTYVGHSLVQKIKSVPSQREARKKLGLVDNDCVIALCPGSRYTEVESLLPAMLESALIILKEFPGTTFILPRASTIHREMLLKIIEDYSLEEKVRVLDEDSLWAMSAADLVLVASGTATLEVALLRKPMVVIYKVNAFTAWLIRKMIRIPYISLCNIVAGEFVVKEFLQEAMTAENISAEVLRILSDETYRTNMILKLTRLSTALDDLNSAERVAHIVLDLC